MTLSRGRFCPRFLQEQDFLGSNLITADHVKKQTVFRGANCLSIFLEIRRSSRILSELCWSSFGGKSAPKRSFSGVHAGLNSSPKNPAPGRNPELKRTRLGTIFKKFNVNTRFTVN
jgi:hypothetical protein